MNAIALDIRGKALATVPSAAFAGLVAPITSRNPLTASSRSSAITMIGPFGHELHQAAEKRPLLVNGVKTLRLRLGEARHAQPDNLETGLWIMARISPACPAATASGLMMENVRSTLINGFELSLLCRPASSTR